jgi:multidrug resistance efflux pump
MSPASQLHALRPTAAVDPQADPSLDTTSPVSSAWRELSAIQLDRARFLRLAGAALLLAALIPGALWAHFQSTHVVTHHALVRSHLSELGVRVEGLVEEVLVTAGDAVQRGDLLARLDDAHLQAQRNEARAALAALDEQLKAAREELELARGQVAVGLLKASAVYSRMQAEEEAMHVQAEDAAAVYAARESLAADGAVSAEVLREAAALAARRRALARASTAAAVEAQADLESARLAEESLAVREAQLRVLSASRAEAMAQLERVEADLAATRVYAPADGAVIRRLAQPGMAVGPGTPLISLWLQEETWIEAWVPEKDLADLALGADVQVRFPMLPGERFAGTIARIGLATDFEMPLDYLPQTREARMRPTPQVGVMVRLHAAPALMRPGMSAIVDIARSAG